MSEPFLSEIKVVSFNFPPKGWALCNGQLLPINQNQALFALLGTTYGGNGQTNFALPDLRDRVPIHQGSGHTRGERGGEAAHTLTLNELPSHTHALNASGSAGDTQAPSNRVLARTTNNIYGNPSNLTTLLAGTTSSVGGSQPHENQQPYLKLNWCIALQGIFPSQN
jgi:microcystin-dependent protein